jgi:UDP-glucose 4-epimerase
MPIKIAVTGASGFIGKVLCSMLRSRGIEVVPIGRELLDTSASNGSAKALGSSMAGAAAVIHLAARAHVMRDEHTNPLAEYRRVNLNGTLRVAEAARGAGARRFVFVSSIGVHGNSSGERVFRETDEPAPVEPYAISKWDAEQALRSLAQPSSLELVIVRPPLVYGPEVKGNFLRLLHLLHRGVPLPLGSVPNRRSYIGVENLCDLLILCASHEAAPGQLFLASDDEDISTPQLLRVLARGMRVPQRVFNCPVPMLRLLASLAGKQAELQRLTASLRVDAGNTRNVLGWRPAVSLQAGLTEMAQWFAHRVR